MIGVFRLHRHYGKFLLLNSGGKFYDTVEERLDSIKDFNLIEALSFDSPIDSIWVRRHNGGYEGDELYWLPSDQITRHYEQEFVEEFGSNHLAIYTFDTVKIVWDTLLDEIPADWDVTDNGIKKSMDGKYLAFNPIGEPDSLDEFQGRIPKIISKIFDFILLDEVLGAVESLAISHAQQVEFYYQDSMVYLLKRLQGDDKILWKVFCYDSWDNCVTPEWLAYKQEIGLDE